MPLNVPETGQKRIVVIGAGFAGMAFLKKMVKSDYQLVVIDRNNFHQFQPLYYQVAMAGLEPSSISFPLRKAFQGKKNVFIRVAEFERLDAENKQIHTSGGYLNYDILIISAGATTNFFGDKNLEQHTYGLKSVSESLALRNDILMHYEKALTERDYEKRQGLIDIVIVGGGATGVELAGALVEMKRFILPKDYMELDNKEVDIYLVQSGPRLLPGMSDYASDRAQQFLEKMGVQVLTGTRVVSYDGESVITKDGKQIRTRKVIWAAGVRGEDIEGLKQNELPRGNRIRVDQFCKVHDYDDIYAIGDIAYMENEEYENGHPQVAPVAIQQARFLAKSFKKGFKKPFSYRNRGSMATVGRNKAVVDMPSFSFSGFTAWAMWLFVHLFSIIGTKNKVFVFLNWLWSYFTYDQSLRLIINPKRRNNKEESS